MKVLDLFSGIGSFAYASERLVGGFETKQFVENNKYCQRVLKKHFPHVPIHDDIRDYTATYGSYQLITFGFPCQDISVAGAQRGIGEGTRSGLFYEAMRIVREVRPKFFLIENVRNLLSIQEGQAFQEVLYQIAKAGYNAEWSIVSAQDVGACHKRERIWIIAYSQHYGSPTTEGVGFNDQTNPDTPQGEEEALQSQGSSEPRYGSFIQQATIPTNTNRKHVEGGRQGRLEEQPKFLQKEVLNWHPQRSILSSDWRSYSSEPVLLRGDARLTNRVDRLKCLGNTICPQSAAVPLARIKQLDKLLVDPRM